MTLLRRICDAALLAIVGVVLALGISVHAAGLVGARVLAIRGPSMTPAIPLGALVVAVARPPSELVAGDVVSLATSGGAVITHRVREVVADDGGRRFRTQGDANPSPDPALVDAGMVIGRVEVALPLLGVLLAMLSTPLGISAIVSTGLTLWVAAWCIELLTEDEDEHAVTLEPVGAR